MMSSLSAKVAMARKKRLALRATYAKTNAMTPATSDAERDREDPVDTLAGRPRRRVSADHRERGLRERELTRDAEHEVEADDEDRQIDPLVED